MKNKGNIFNFLFSGLVLFSILFQSFHSFAHLFEQMSEEICVHEHDENQPDLTHAHHGFDNCFVCHFSFSPFKLSDTPLIEIKKCELFSNHHFVYSKQVFLFFKGSLFTLRAPPKV